MASKCRYNKDFHSHVLPQIDDGAQTVQESLLLLEKLKKQGADTIVATPHFYITRQSLDHFWENRENAYKRIKEASENKNIPQIVLGAEVFYHPMLFSLEDIQKLCIGNSPYMLLELPYKGIDKSVIAGIEKLIDFTGLIPVLAHIEIYPPKIIDQLMKLALLGQMNLPSFLDPHIKKDAMKLVKKGYCHVLGTDCHNLSSRPPYFMQGLEALTSSFDSKYIEQMEKIGAKILG